MSKDIQKKVTDKILNLMKNGQFVWSKEWSGEIKMRLPKNGLTNQVYKGVNFWNLAIESQERGFLTGEWVTFCQLQDLSKKRDKQLKIKKGSKGESVIFYKLLKNCKEDEKTKELKTFEVPLMKYSTVFNLSQIEGLEAEILEKNNIKTSINDDFNIDLSRLDLKFENAPQMRACYSSSTDVILLPMREQFKSLTAYYATTFHELVHWTGHESRLNRKLGNAKDSKEYAFEELIAEFGASFLCAQYGIDYETQHAAYLKSWLNVLENDETLLFKAIAQAQKAADYIMEKLNPIDEQLEAARKNLTENEKASESEA